MVDEDREGVALIDTRYIDHDLTPPDDQSTGMLSQSADAFAMGVQVGDIEDTELIPRSRWDEVAKVAEPLLRGSIKTVLNQGRISSCVAAATVGAMQVAGALQFGEYTRLSWGSLYSRIGSTAYSGSYIPDGINEARTIGVLPADGESFPATFPPGDYNPRSLRNRDWMPTAKQFRCHRVLRINSVDGWFTALVSGWPVVYGRRGHAIYSVLAKRNRGDWLFGYCNSWGQWGDRINDELPYGMGWDTERTIRGCVGYAICSVVRPEGVTL